jgi:hypothetical protein
MYVLTAVSIVLAAMLAPQAAAERRALAHPYFGDRGTLDWYRKFEDAKAAARREGKVVLIENGRLRCGTCRVLVSSILPSSRVRGRVSSAAVGLASDCDRPEAAVLRLFRKNLPGERRLPRVAFVTPDGEWISGYGGGTSTNRFLSHLRKAEAWLARNGGRVQPPPQPTPVVRPASPAPPSPPSPLSRHPRVIPVPCESPDAPPEGTPVPPSEPLPPPATPNRYPAPALHGDPDAADAEPPCENCAPPPVRRPGTLPPPRVVINPPVLVRRSAGSTPAARPAPEPTRTTQPSAPVVTAVGRAREAARSGDWSTVLAMASAQPNDARLADLSRQAHRWAHRELDNAVKALEERRYEDALTFVKTVLLQMQGQPESVDAEAGLGAIRTLLELRYLDPNGAVAPAVRRNSFEELRGTRWAQLFD